MSQFNQLSKQKYINLETFRKSGLSVRTPVWFVQDGDNLYVRTVANSGKVKRIRNNGQVNIAPCKMDGAVVGEWTSALGREVKDTEVYQKVDRLLSKKYGLAKTMFAMVSSMQGREYTVLELKGRK
jgi:uncharacterized protein